MFFSIVFPMYCMYKHEEVRLKIIMILTKKLLWVFFSEKKKGRCTNVTCAEDEYCSRGVCRCKDTGRGGLGGKGGLGGLGGYGQGGEGGKGGQGGQGGQGGGGGGRCGRNGKDGMDGRNGKSYGKFWIYQRAVCFILHAIY